MEKGTNGWSLETIVVHSFGTPTGMTMRDRPAGWVPPSLACIRARQGFRGNAPDKWTARTKDKGGHA